MSNDLGNGNNEHEFDYLEEEEERPKKISKVRLYSAIVFGLVVVGAIIAFLLKPNEQVPNESAIVTGDSSLFKDNANGGNGLADTGTMDANGNLIANGVANGSMNSANSQPNYNEVPNQDKGVLNNFNGTSGSSVGSSIPQTAAPAPAAPAPAPAPAPLVTKTAEPAAPVARVDLIEKKAPAAVAVEPEVATPPKPTAKKVEKVEKVEKAEKPKAVATASAKKESEPETLPPLTAKSWRIQLVALSKRDRVEEEWVKLQSSFRPLANLHHRIEVTENAATQTQLYRLHAGPFKDEAAARSACQALKDQSQACSVVIPQK